MLHKHNLTHELDGQQHKAKSGSNHFNKHPGYKVTDLSVSEDQSAFPGTEIKASQPCNLCLHKRAKNSKLVPSAKVDVNADDLCSRGEHRGHIRGREHRGGREEAGKSQGGDQRTRG